MWSAAGAADSLTGTVLGHMTDTVAVITYHSLGYVGAHFNYGHVILHRLWQSGGVERDYRSVGFADAMCREDFCMFTAKPFENIVVGIFRFNCNYSSCGIWTVRGLLDLNRDRDALSVLFNCDLGSSQDACGMFVVINRNVKAIGRGVVLVRGYLGVKGLRGRCAYKVSESTLRNFAYAGFR